MLLTAAVLSGVAVCVVTLMCMVGGSLAFLTMGFIYCSLNESKNHQLFSYQRKATVLAQTYRRTWYSTVQ
jgi:hypothetical protein